ncbi:PLP-dependent aminotransferase family protein [Labrys sp. KB_33_2]|uniref:MocR-like pyridoxine biosynthesis transcription factor PdxR n=1 Tax=unclassified Labrys (in: a-proteobacteria) TaxID=2688601 RepID=UPI003EC13989
MSAPFRISIDRTAQAPLAVQIHRGIAAAIRDGRLANGARLPSWRDLAAQLGVARGTVRVAYEKLADEQLIAGMGAAGTRVIHEGALPKTTARLPVATPLPTLFPDFERPPATFQMGVPAQDAFPFSLWSRIMARSARAAAAAPVSYPDPRGHIELRREIAAYLALARGIQCEPDQVLVTSGYSGALGLILRALGLDGRKAWLEDPAFVLTRVALEQARVTITPVPVDPDGIDVAAGLRLAPDAAFAVVTPGQQAPLGLTLSLERRLALLDWAQARQAWIIEDDYLSELQLRGRAAPALASLDRRGRVLHAGTFSKTITPALRLGFLVVPPQLAARFGDVAAALAPASAVSIQRAVASFLAEGHYLRHLRRMKRLYAARRDALASCLTTRIGSGMKIHANGGLAVLLDLPDTIDDVAVSRQALPFGIAPVPLSPWYSGARRAGLLLGVTNVDPRRIASDCDRLLALVAAHG